MKHRFKDDAGRTWDVNVNITTLKSVRDLLDIDLLKLAENNFALLARLGDDFVLTVDVLYVLCREQAQAAGVSDTQFGQAMRGDAIEAGFDAMIGGLCDFMPNKERRNALRVFLGQVRKAQGQIYADIAKVIDAINVGPTPHA